MNLWVAKDCADAQADLSTPGAHIVRNAVPRPICKAEGCFVSAKASRVHVSARASRVLFKCKHIFSNGATPVGTRLSGTPWEL